MLTVDNVKLSYSKNTVLERLSFQAYQGEILGVLGKNGMGKSTLLQALVGLKKVETGTIKLNSKNIGYMPETADVYEYLTGLELLEIVAELKNISLVEVHGLLTKLQKYIFLPELNNIASTYSKGNREKLLFALALLGTPDILVMDEPFTGFDPESALGAKNFLREYVHAGHLILLSTHIIEMAAQLCNRIIVLKSKHESQEINLREETDFNKRIKLLEKVFNNFVPLKVDSEQTPLL